MGTKSPGSADAEDFPLVKTLHSPRQARCAARLTSSQTMAMATLTTAIISIRLPGNAPKSMSPILMEQRSILLRSND
jgi:hypothetical protein